MPTSEATPCTEKPPPRRRGRTPPPPHQSKPVVCAAKSGPVRVAYRAAAAPRREDAAPPIHQLSPPSFPQSPRPANRGRTSTAAPPAAVVAVTVDAAGTVGRRVAADRPLAAGTAATGRRVTTGRSGGRVPGRCVVTGRPPAAATGRAVAAADATAGRRDATGRPGAVTATGSRSTSGRGGTGRRLATRGRPVDGAAGRRVVATAAVNVGRGATAPVRPRGGTGNAAGTSVAVGTDSVADGVVAVVVVVRGGGMETVVADWVLGLRGSPSPPAGGPMAASTAASSSASSARSISPADRPLAAR